MYFLIKDYVQLWRMKKASKYVQGRVLDVGCGQAVFKTLLPQTCEYTGVDIHLNGLHGHNYLEVDIESGNRQTIDGLYDTIVMLAVLEHLYNPADVLAWCYTKLVPGGRLVITTPTVVGDFIIGRIFRMEVGHIKIFNHSELLDICTMAGFDVKTYNKFEFGANQILVGEKC